MSLKLSLGEWPKSMLEEERQRGPLLVHSSGGDLGVRYPPFAIFDPYGIGLAQKLVLAETVTLAEKQLLRAEHATIIPQRFFEVEGQIYSDFPLSPIIMENYIDGRFDVPPRDHMISFDGEGYTSEHLNVAVEQIAGSFALITSSEPINYGAWLIRVLPKIWMSRNIIQEDFKFICYCERDWQKSLLNLAGIPNTSVIEQTFSKAVKVDRLYIPSWPNQNKFLCKDTLRALKDVRLAAQARIPNFSGPKAVYVSRLNWSKKINSGKIRYRPFDQEEEFCRILSRLGFTIYCPEDYSIEEQILTFYNAQIVVGPQGAGMFNTVFCKPGTTVLDIEHLPNFLSGHARLFSSAGLRYGLIIGQIGEDPAAHSVQKPLVIDMDGTVSFIERVLTDLTAGTGNT